MCGISGIITPGISIDKNKLVRMNQVAAHRGPDDEGYYIFDKNGRESFYIGRDSSIEAKKKIENDINMESDVEPIVALCHRRLSIIDLSVDGFQPMKFGNNVLVFNGEIYNYIEIKKMLEEKGVFFNTNSDSEVLLKAYEFWGEECVSYFDGMWSFAIWDNTKRKLFCSRDRFGEKPFHYYFDEDQFVFASEIKQILEFGIKFEVNEKVLNRFIKYSLLDIGESTFFSGIKSLLPGHNLTVEFSSNNKPAISIENYYKITYEPNRVNNYTESAKKFGELFETSINLRLRSDVSVGSCLSGGLDSSSIVTLAKANLKKVSKNNHDFDTFTAVYDESPSVDERYYSDIVVKESGVRNFYTKPTSELLASELENLIWHQEQPFHSFSVFAGWMVMKEAKNQNIKVLLDGQGGDEALLGYSRLLSYALFDQLKALKIIKLITSLKSQARNNEMKISRLVLELFYFNLGFIRKWRQGYRYKGILNKDFSKQFNKDLEIKTLLTVKNLKAGQKIDLNQLLTSLLRYEDRNAMAHSIETRLPFLSKDLVDFCYSTPADILLKNGWSKSIMREYMRDKMSNTVVYRKRKLGFAVPEDKWMVELQSQTNTLLESNILSHKYFDLNWINKYKDKPKYSKLIFKFLIVENWLRVFEKYA